MLAWNWNRAWNLAISSACLYSTKLVHSNALGLFVQEAKLPLG